ncbi:hypothetical protein [Legionella fallonii]|uniref:Putative transmembrane protein n=1 Tax=Legionella fallonii LLAP-10 TaxID=1212491 RepID=A0A098G9H0_9GAMM|nr:hypothetical protein [Legionella fallonii]CEG58115.1 putative transmembrane protein [Legionella fallonii LLAP-10]
MTFTVSSNPITPDFEEVCSQQSKSKNVKEQLFPARKLFYSFYLIIDASKLSFSTIRYLFDMYFSNTDAATQAMQEWISSPVGFSTIMLSTSSFIILSLLSNHLKEKDKNYLILLWPYAREAMKCLRNTYRAVQSTLTLICFLDMGDLRNFIVSTSLLLGAAAVLNRVWFRSIASQRTKIMDENKKLLAEIQAATELDELKISQFINRIQVQSQQLRTQLLCSALVSGLIDGLNPYIGILILGSVTPSSLAVITVFCIIYFIATVAIKIYDELKTQEQLENQEREIHLALLEKQNLTIGHRPVIEIAPTPILISGLKNGMTGYKCIMLTISTILFLSPIKFKSIEPINRAILGLGSLFIFLTHACFSSFMSQVKCDKDQVMNVDSSLSSPLVQSERELDLKTTDDFCNTKARTYTEVDRINGDLFLEEKSEFYLKKNSVFSTNKNAFFPYRSNENEIEVYQPALNVRVGL